jgi:hypothetical protein
MKTKLTLFVTVLAAALFGVGCASTPKGPPHPNAVIWNGHWYAFFPSPISWNEAKKHCESIGGHLVIIESKEENEFVWDLATLKKASGMIHIGCFRADNDGPWEWVDGRPVSNTYYNWARKAFLRIPDGVLVGKMVIDHGRTNHEGTRYPKDWVVRGTVDPYQLAYICEWE